MESGFQESIDQVESALENAADMDSFLFAAISGEEITATKGINSEEMDVASLLGIQLLTIAEEANEHPAVLAHAAVQWAISQSRSDDPLISVDHDQ